MEIIFHARDTQNTFTFERSSIDDFAFTNSEECKRTNSNNLFAVTID